ncbi:MAG: nuclear transport factor 2 family protein [Vicinamibacterales bacterium]
MSINDSTPISQRLLGCFGIALFLAVAPHQVLAQAADADAVRGILTAYAEFTQAKNLAAVDSLMAPERGVHIIEGAGVNHGWADYRDRHIGPELADAENFRYRFYSVEPQIRGDVAWAAFRFDLAAIFRGEAIDREGRGTAVLERRNGRWVIVHLHTSSRPRPAAGVRP